MKIYPGTYALPIALTLRTPESRAVDKQRWRRIIRFTGSFLNTELFLFAAVAGGVFCGLTALFYHMWDEQDAQNTKELISIVLYRQVLSALFISYNNTKYF